MLKMIDGFFFPFPFIVLKFFLRIFFHLASSLTLQINLFTLGQIPGCTRRIIVFIFHIGLHYLAVTDPPHRMSSVSVSSPYTPLLLSLRNHIRTIGFHPSNRSLGTVSEF